MNSHQRRKAYRRFKRCHAYFGRTIFLPKPKYTAVKVEHNQDTKTITIHLEKT